MHGIWNILKRARQRLRVIGDHIMYLCYVMLCYVMLCYVMLCYVMLCRLIMPFYFVN
jgi:hypothetical protein